MIHPKICSLLLLFFYFPIIFSPAALGNVRQQPSPCTLMYWMSRWSSLCVQGPLFSPAVCSRLQQQEEEAEACFGAMLNPCTLHCPVRPSVRLPACLPASLPACLPFFHRRQARVWIFLFQAQSVFVFWDSRLHTVDVVFHHQHHLFFFFSSWILLLQQQIQNYFFFFFFNFSFNNKFKIISSSSSATNSKLFLLLLLQQQIQNYFFFFFFFFFFLNSFSSSATDSKLFLLLVEFFFFSSSRFKSNLQLFTGLPFFFKHVPNFQIILIIPKKI